MHYNLTTNIDVCVNDSGFSLDELVYRMSVLHREKAFPELLAEILMMYDGYVRLDVMQCNYIPLTCSCGGNMYVLDGRRARKVRTTIGTVDLPNLTRVKCAHCGKTHVPVIEICGLDLYQTKTAGVEKLIIEQCAQTSYRRATKSVGEMTGVCVSHSTSHRWVLKSDADEISVPEDVIATVKSGNPAARQPEPVTIFADGTYCKGRDADGHAEKGVLKAMIGVRQSGDVFPIGTWSGDVTWKDIKEELQRKKVQFAEGSILVCDGEEEIAENLAKFANGSFQRCQWHCVHDTYHAMWEDGGRAKEIKPVQNKLKHLLAIEIPKEDIEEVDEAQALALEVRMKESESSITSLVEDIRARGFVKAASYLERAKHAMFNYLRRWLALGIVCPRASSLIERTMRELARRLKRIAYGWKEEGLSKISKFILKIFSNEEEWRKYWEKRMAINQNVLVNFKMIKPTSVDK